MHSLISSTKITRACLLNFVSNSSLKIVEPGKRPAALISHSGIINKVNLNNQCQNLAGSQGLLEMRPEAGRLF